MSHAPRTATSISTSEKPPISGARPESRLPPDTGSTPVRKPSPLQRLLETFNAAGPARVSFTDITGISYDVPEITVDWEWHCHTCRHCLLMKELPRGHERCLRNKTAALRLVCKKGVTLAGNCHAGLYDLVEPLTYRSIVVGAFFYGSIRLKGSDSGSRLIRHARRAGLDPKPLLQSLEQIRAVGPEELETLRDRLQALRRATEAMLEAAAPPIEHYRVLPMENRSAFRQRPLPAIVKRALAWLPAQLEAELSLKAVAAALHCHPVYLGQRFRETMGCTLAEHITKARVERACRLLQTSSLSVAEIAVRCGFADQSHFARTFRRAMGKSPKEFRKPA